jgi:hypothetical protein
MTRRNRWMVLRNGQAIGLSPPNPLSEASARMLAEVLSNETPGDELSVVEWTSDQPADWNADTDTVVRFRAGAEVGA